MPTPAFMTLHGEHQGLISAGAFTEASVGNTYQKGREDQIMIQALSHGIFVPKGSGAGRRMHKPLIVTKAIDKATPLINNALCSGELLKICRVEWYRSSAQGIQEHFYTMELEDAVIIGAEVLMPHCQDPGTAHLTQVEKVHFSYRRIYWRHEVSRTMGSDEWSTEVSG
ncbi:MULTISPECIES: Hcp family type VI secretion system effector [unclassified Pseudomonas]|uniref:Hcp family type VI secretion system effector n=1 Tax=unclassified Pseudomonas TaxID=196821 RepID=UPI000FAFF168|nr:MULTISPECIES: Hcp family type VI secretion system effector [unclassified Pseudomonas]